jgi:hypothetical protein
MTKRKNTAIRLIRKQARGFRTGETLYLYHCDTGDRYGVLSGPFEITEIKHQSDMTVSFFIGSIFPGQSTLRPTQGLFLVEFKRDELLHRLAGEPLRFLIQEEPVP